MLLGILSDTHDHLEHIALAKKVLADRGADPVVHLGDICAGPAVRAMAGMPLIGIVGNNDGDLLGLQRNFKQIDADFRGQFAVLEFDGLRIACYHGTVAELTDALIKSTSYDVVLTGHTHEATIEERDGVLALNPGSVHGFGKPGTVAILDTITKHAEILTLG